MSDKQQAYLSRSLSFILRHKDRSGGSTVRIDHSGFASLDDVVTAINSHQKTRIIDAGMIVETVHNDVKGRFELVDDGEVLRIRALSGHTFRVDIAGNDFTPEGPLWFGTTMEAFDRIEEHGLACSAKLKARLRATREEAEAIAASRRGDPLLIEVDAERLSSHGYRFTRLSNGEIVTDRFGREYCTLHLPVTPPIG